MAIFNSFLYVYQRVNDCIMLMAKFLLDGLINSLEKHCIFLTRTMTPYIYMFIYIYHYVLCLPKYYVCPLYQINICVFG